jgi:hypothetical protein
VNFGFAFCNNTDVPYSRLKRQRRIATMASSTINVLLTTFPGLGLPRTLNLLVPSTSTVGDVERIITTRLPSNASNLNLTTTSNKLLSSHRSEPITSLLTEEDGSSPFLPLRLSAALCGGKGGFGSQLRAAGGRISSRRKKQGEQNGSSRTLDGRRIRTVNEAKALAEYLAIKPDMERHEKDERRKRLEEIVKSTEARKAEILSGGAGGKSRLDGEWLEGKEEAAEKAREAVLAALRNGDVKGVFGEERESDSSGSASDYGEGSESEEAEETEEKKSNQKPQTQMKFFGWDEDEMSHSEDEDIRDQAERVSPMEDIKEEAEVIEEPPPTTRKTRSKGKAKA